MVNLNPTPRHDYFETARFGPLPWAEVQLLHLLEPLPPFWSLRTFALLSCEEELPLEWLQSVEQPALALPVAPYEVVTGEAAPPLPTEVAQALGIATGEQPAVYVILTLAPELQEVTVNLLAPVYVCRRNGRARQVILEGDLSLTRSPLPALPE
jgi:flagellar assembly factor FliW